MTSPVPASVVQDPAMPELDTTPEDFTVVVGPDGVIHSLSYAHLTATVTEANQPQHLEAPTSGVCKRPGCRRADLVTG